VQNLSARKRWDKEDLFAVSHAPDRLSRGQPVGRTIRQQRRDTGQWSLQQDGDVQVKALMRAEKVVAGRVQRGDTAAIPRRVALVPVCFAPRGRGKVNMQACPSTFCACDVTLPLFLPFLLLLLREACAYPVNWPRPLVGDAVGV